MAHILRSDPFVAEVSFNTICSKMWFQKVLKALSHLLLILGCFVHFLPPNLPKYSSNDLKFSWRCFFDELRKLLKNHWIMCALVVLPQRANVWKVFKKAHFWPFFGIFYPQNFCKDYLIAKIWCMCSRCQFSHWFEKI